ncbi:hypothetical protein PTKIN_Ptkin06aG0157000 [Pterospermum kingtungense]
MDAVISIVGSLAGKAAEYTVDPIARQFSYFLKPETKFQNLRSQLQQLKDAREKVQQDVNEAKRQGEETFSYVDRWLTEVNGQISEEAAAQLQDDEEKTKQRCFVGLCPNFKSRYQLSRKVEKEANTIAQLLKEKYRFGGVSYGTAPEGIATRPVKEYEDYESRTGAFNAVMKALKDANLSIIGSFDIKKIQNQLADELGLKFDQQSDSGRAGELRNRLKKTNKRNLAIEILKEEEAWDLFQKMSTDIVLRNDLQDTVKEVAKRCARLPIAIATVGKAMKSKKTLSEWKDAFIMGHDAAMEDLLKYSIGLGLFHGVKQSEKHKIEHDVVRDVAISIASRDRHWLSLQRDDVFKDEETLRYCNLISLQNAKVSEFVADHDQLECPNLTFFSLSSEDPSLKFPNNFFEGLQKLSLRFCQNAFFFSGIFKSSHFKFSIYPHEYGSLSARVTALPVVAGTVHLYPQGLNSLPVAGKALPATVDKAIIGELKSIEILSLRKSEVAVLPGEIGQLTKLKSLDLSHCYSLEVTSAKVLSPLSRLEELYLYYSFNSWEVEGHDEKPKPMLALMKRLERFKICIGREWIWHELHDKLETSRNLNLMLNKSIHLYSIWLKRSLRKTESLHLNAVKDAMDMLYDPDIEGYLHLKHLHIRNDSEVKHIINPMMLVSCKVFPLLESLILEKLMNLETICNGQLKAEYFVGLRIIKVEFCKILKNLFSFGIARELRQLQEIMVSDCENCAELIIEKLEEEGGDDDIAVEFSQLRSLTLKRLPNF